MSVMSQPDKTPIRHYFDFEERYGAKFHQPSHGTTAFRDERTSVKTRILALAGSVAIAAPLALATMGTANAAPTENPPVTLADNVTSPGSA